MKKFILIFCFIFIQIAAADNSFTDKHAFTLLQKASRPRVVTVLNNEHTGDRIEKGILFTYKNRKSDDVSIAGNFSQWTPVPMERGNNGVWFYFLPEYEADSNIVYKFLIDGIWTYDPENTRRTGDGTGSFLSITEPAYSSEDRHITYRLVEEDGIQFVEFRTWQPDAGYVSVAGDFNNWNPENDPLTRSAGGIWKGKVHIPPGTYRYKLVIDGTWTVDLYNPDTASDDTDGICSVLKIPEH